jgi:hypothetical protein
VDHLNEWLDGKIKGSKPVPLARSYLLQEEMDARETPQKKSKETLSDQALKEINGIMSADPEQVLSNDNSRAFFDSLRRARPRVAVFIQPIDPDAVAKMPTAVQKNYVALLALCEKQLKDDRIPFETLQLNASDFSDFNHFSVTGHDQAIAVVENLLKRLESVKP